MNQNCFSRIYLLQRLRIRLKSIANLCTSTTPKWSKPTGISTDFHIHHTVTKESVPFVRKSENYVSWYICGPTVYDSPHLGHASCYMRFDIIRRILQIYLNKPIIQAMCITNIDDKIIARSNENGIDWKVLTNTYEKEFFTDLASLNIPKPAIVARATDFIPQMIRFIERLLQKKFAYRATDGSVYFDLQKYGTSGKFRSIVLNYQYQQEPSPYKKCSADFALWKAAKPSEPYWQSPWGPGRPGWHIECSAIASEYFGDSIDLHSGGYDLIFPHHENEETQSCAYHGTDQWVNYWMHSGQLHLSKDNEKMSKSLKNTISIKDFLGSYSHQHFRMLCFMMHYRTDIQYNAELMETSVRYCNKFINFFGDCIAHINGYSNKGDVDGPKLLQILDETKRNVAQALYDDFDTEVCLRHLQHLMNETNVMLFPDSGRRCPVSIALVYNYIRDILNSFGFNFGDTISNVDSKSSIKVDSLIDSSVVFRDDVREIALASKKKQMDFQDGCSQLLKLCDNFRQELRLQGIFIKDHKDNKSTWTCSEAEKKE